MQTIGIGITCRNRPDVLRLALKHHVAFSSTKYNTLLVISDDSDDQYKIKNYEVLKSAKIPAKFIINTSRQGVAKNKNNCIRALRNCDYIFLFDEDCFPMHERWEDYYIQTAIETQTHHSMFLKEEGIINLQKEDDYYKQFSNCAGCLLFFTKEGLSKVGGFDERFEIYGFEHAQLSARAFELELTKFYSKYLAPKLCDQYIYAMDFDLKYDKHPPLQKINFNFTSSIAGEDIKENLNKNRVLHMDLSKLKVEI